MVLELFMEAVLQRSRGAESERESDEREMPGGSVCSGAHSCEGLS